MYGAEATTKYSTDLGRAYYMQLREGRRAGGLVHQGAGTWRGVSVYLHALFLDFDPWGGRRREVRNKQQEGKERRTPYTYSTSQPDIGWFCTYFIWFNLL
jgi:hypothetical protein